MQPITPSVRFGVSHLALAVSLSLFGALPALAQTLGDGTPGTPAPSASPQPTPDEQPAPGPSTATGAQTSDEQTPAPEDEEAIVVTGFRAALQTAIETKRELNVVAEVFSAEDIGKLPDTSIAETLGRLPGLATQRLDGRSQVLSIRGLGPDFSTTLLNGREQVSSSDNRGVEYDQYPSELISSGIVYKTPFAGLIGQGLAGSVDLRTARPLAFKDRVISLAARYEFNEDGSLNPDQNGDGFRVTGTYIDQFADDTIGVALGVAYQSSPTQIKRFETWGFPTTTIGGEEAFVIGGLKPYVRSTELDRLGIFGTLEYQPMDGLNSAIDVFYSDYRENQASRGIEFPLFWGGGGEVLQNAVVEDGLVVAGEYANVRGVVRNDFNRKTTENFAIGWRTTLDREKFKLDLDLNYSRADRSSQLVESYSGTGYGVTGVSDTLGFRRRGDGTYELSSRLDYTDPNLIQLTDPRGWGGGNSVVQAGFVNAPDTLDELKQIRFAAKRKIGWGPLEGIELGFNYADRSKDRDIGQFYLTLGGVGNTLTTGATRIRPIPADILSSRTTGLNFLGLGDQVTYNPFKLIEGGVYTPVDVALSSFAVAQSWRVEEKVWTGWVRADLDGDIGGVKLTGNIGGQVVHTDQSSRGARPDLSSIQAGTVTATFIPVNDGAEYTYFLPSLNLSFRLAERTQLRLGAARTLARARMDQLNSSLTPSIDLTRLPSTNPGNSAFRADGGNARLRPYIADGGDISLEHYFAGNRGYVSVAGYYKKLSNYVNPSFAILTDFSFLREELTPAQLAILGTSLGITTGPANDGEGDLYGVEATLSLPFEVLTPALEGFGIQSSASYTYSSITFSGNEDSITIPGLSDWVVNTTAYFERWGFEARISHRYRSDFLAEVSGISATRELRTAKAESIFDAQIGYRFGKDMGALSDLSITFQGLNLTDEPFVTFETGDERRVRTLENYGRTYLIGVSKKF